MQKYFDDFAETHWSDAPAGWPRVCADFKIDIPEPDVLFASYQQGGYEGDALVLFKQDGKLYRVSGSHCSCYGLEGQWEPEETTVEALRHELNTEYKYGVIGARTVDIWDAIKNAEGQSNA